MRTVVPEDERDEYFIEHLRMDSRTTSMPSAHHHDRYEFYFYLGESMTYFIDNEPYIINKYDLVFIEKNTYHRTIYKTNCKERILFMVSDSIFDLLQDKTPVYDALARIAKTPKMTFDDESREKIYLAVKSIVEENTPENELTIKIDLINFILKVDRFIKYGHLAPSIDSKTDDDTKITEIIDFLLKNYSSKITLDTLEKRFFISKYHLCRKFKEATGQTVVAFLNEKRLTSARAMLVVSNQSVLDISAQTGFESANHFNELFKKKYGLTPYKYRQWARKKDM